MKARPLREGETPADRWRCPSPTRRRRPPGFGTDDYRCFLLDPKLDEDAWITGTNVLPGNPDVVHHVILFRVPPRQVAQAEQLDEDVAGRGLDLLRRHRPRRRSRASTTPPWLGAWAPGGAESVHQRRLRRQARAGLADRDAGALQPARRRRPRTSPPPSCGSPPRDADLTDLGTMLLPGTGRAALPSRPRRLPALRPRRRGGRRQEALRRRRRLHRRPPLLPVRRPAASRRRAVLHPHDPPADDDHGRRRPHAPARPLDQDRGQPRHRPRRRRVLDIPVWDFDNQGAKPIKPVHLDTGDTVEVTCRHVQWLRDQLPVASRARTSGTSCGARAPPTRCASGILQVTHP